MLTTGMLLGMPLPSFLSNSRTLNQYKPRKVFSKTTTLGVILDTADFDEVITVQAVPGNHLPRDRPFRIILTSWRNFNIVFFFSDSAPNSSGPATLFVSDDEWSILSDWRWIWSVGAIEDQLPNPSHQRKCGFESTIRETPGARIRWNITYLRFRYQLSTRRRVERFGPMYTP